MVVAVLLLLCKINPPTVLNWPLKLIPVVLWIVMVIESAVMLAVLLSRITSSLYQGLLALIAGVTVTPPVPPPASLTVSPTVVVRVRPPPLPVTVTLATPRVAVLEAVRFRMLLPPVVDGGVKVAVTPAGNPLALSATLPVNPPVRVIVIVLVPLAPRVIVTLGGAAESVKLGVATSFTVRPTVVERLRPPPLPLIVTVAAPSVAVLEAARVRVLLPPVVDGGAKVAVTPVGNPLALSVTLSVNPPVRVIAIVLVPLPPRLIVRDGGAADSVKLGAATTLTVRPTVVERVRPPPVPLTVIVAGPVAAVLDAARVRVLLPPVVDDGVKDASTPAGNPLAVSATLSVKPPLRVIVIVLVPLAP